MFKNITISEKVSIELSAQVKLLCEIAINEGFNIYKIDITGAGNDGNFLGFVYKVKISSKDEKECSKKSIDLFMKIAAERMRKTFPVHDMYCNEFFTYKCLANVYAELQINAKIPFEKMFKFAKFYGSIENNANETIVLENLTTRNYGVHDRFRCISFDYANIAVQNLAKFHALSFILEQKDPMYFNNYVRMKKGNIYIDYNGPERILKQKEMIVNNAVKNLRNEAHAIKVKNFCEDMCNNITKYVKINKHAVLCHGDYKGNNLLVRYERGFVTSMIAIDYQLIHYGSPLYDLMYFIFVTTDSTFRKLYFKNIIETYYSALTEFLQMFLYNIEDVYPRNEFDKDLKDTFIMGMIVAVQVLPYILVSVDETPDLNEVNESAFLKAMRCPNEVFLERYNEIVEEFISNNDI